MVFVPRLPAGTVVEGRYRVHSVLDQRDGITRYAGHHLTLARAVWLDVLEPSCAVEPRLRERFLRGLQLATRLGHHRSIAPVLDFGDVVQDGVACPFAVVPYQPGPSLAQRIDERGPASLQECIAVLEAVLLGLQHAHAHGVVHRRVNPHNVFLVPAEGGREIARLTGFGTSSLLGASPDEKLLVAGPTIAPEQLLAEAIDGRADLYAVAATAFVMLTGEPLFSQAFGQRDLTRAVLRAPPPSVRLTRHDLPRALDEWMQRGLSKDPRDRFDSAEDMRLALLESLHRPSATSLRPTEPARQSTH